MASWPHAKKTFSQIVNGITKLIAAIFNVGYDEIEAIQTSLGPMGCTSQAYTDNLKNLLISYRFNCEVYYNAVDSVKIKIGKIAIPDASGNVRWRTNTAEVTANWANLDTGAEANSTMYYVYAVADSAATTFTIKISANATTPTGCTFYKLLGSFYNDASGDILQESVDNNDELPKKLRTRVTKTVDIVYYAYTDGFVSAVIAAENSFEKVISIYSDASNPPTTKIQTLGVATGSGNTSKGSLKCEIKKGDYYKVARDDSSGVVTVYWTPNS